MTELAVIAAAIMVGVANRNRRYNAGQMAQDEALWQTHRAFAGTTFGGHFRTDEGRSCDLSYILDRQQRHALTERAYDMMNKPHMHRYYEREINDDGDHLEQVDADEIDARVLAKRYLGMPPLTA